MFNDCHALPCMWHGWRQGHHLEVAQPEFYVFLKNLSIDAFGVYIDFQPHKNNKNDTMLIAVLTDRGAFEVLIQIIWRWNLNDLLHMQKNTLLPSIFQWQHFQKKVNVRKFARTSLNNDITLKLPTVWVGLKLVYYL